MNTQDARWRVVVPIENIGAWERALAELAGLGVEGIIELEGRAEAYFARFEDAEQAARRLGRAEPELELAGPELGGAGGGEVFGETPHPTTELCLAWMPGVVSVGDRVIDVGSGSGRLAARARELGAGLCVAVDVDWPAAVASKASGAEAFHGSVDALREGTFDGVLANLHLALWRELAPEIARVAKPGSWLMASGLLEVQEGEVRTLLGALGWNVEQTALRDGWLGLRAYRMRART